MAKGGLIFRQIGLVARSAGSSVWSDLQDWASERDALILLLTDSSVWIIIVRYARRTLTFKRPEKRRKV